jgi:hypothetical protein
MEEIRNRLGVSYEEARYALQQAGGDVAAAMVIAEQDRETAGGGLAAASMAFMDELQEFISQGEMRKVRVKLGHRLLKEFNVSPRTAIGMLGIAVAAVLLTKLRIEVERAPEALDEFQAPGFSQE